jgi:hypothetical protein
VSEVEGQKGFGSCILMARDSSRNVSLDFEPDSVLYSVERHTVDEPGGRIGLYANPALVISTAQNAPVVRNPGLAGSLGGTGTEKLPGQYQTAANAPGCQDHMPQTGGAFP